MRVENTRRKISTRWWDVSHPDFHNGALPLSASAINPNDKSFTQKDLKILLRQGDSVRY
jgi:N-ethylmaleimide reductase